MSPRAKTRPLGSPAQWDDDPTVVWSPEWAGGGEETTQVELDKVEEIEPEPEPPLGHDATMESADSRGPTQAHRPDVEVEVRKVSIDRANAQPVVYEIWTKNRVYNLDAQLICVEVIDLATGAPNDRHPFLTARLVGGQKQGPKETELSYPMPSPGSDAVFQKSNEANKITLSTTSRVTRVILHVQRTIVTHKEKDGAWGRITRH